MENKAYMEREKIQVADPLVDHLKMTVTLLNEADRKQLSEYLGCNISNKAELIQAIGGLTTLAVSGVDENGSHLWKEVTLEPYLLNRLKSRCHPTEDFGEFVKRVILEQLHAYAGC